MRDEEAADAAPWAWIAALTALAVVLRAIGLNGGLWFDEIATLTDSVRLPLHTILTEFPGNNQHTFYSVLAHLSTAVFGEHAWSLRLPALLFGAATVPALYLLAREFCGRVEALAACLLLATSYHHVWFSQNARGYSALAFVAVVGTWLLLRVLRSGRMSDAVWYGVVLALGVYTHLTMVFTVASHALVVALVMWRARPGDPIRAYARAVAIAFALAAVFTFLFYSPVLLDLKQFFVDKAKPVAVATPLWAVLEMIKGLRLDLGAGVAAVAGGVLVLAGIWSYNKQNPIVAALFVMPGVVTVGATVVLGRPIFPRFVFFLIGFALLIVVRGVFEVARLVAGRPQTTGALVVCLMAVGSFVMLRSNYQYPKQDYAGALAYVEAQHAAGEPIVTVGLTDFVYRKFYGRDWPTAKSADALEAMRAVGPRVWVLYTLAGYIEHDWPDLMAMLRRDCAVSSVFRGTVGYGDITVCVLPALTRSAR